MSHSSSASLNASLNELTCDDDDKEEERWVQGYDNNLSSQLTKCRKDGFLTDFIVRVGSYVDKVHRVVLASGSDYFRAFFSHDMLEKTKDEIELKEMDSVQVGKIIDFLYTGKILLCMAKIQDVIEVATFLQVPTAITVCHDFLKEKTTFDNVHEISQLAEMFAMAGFESYERCYILDKFLPYCESESFLKSDVDVLVSYLEDDSLKTSTEGMLLKAFLRWYEHDKSRRHADAHKLFERIRYSLDGWPLIEFAKKTEPFTTCETCKAMLTEATSLIENPVERLVKYSYKTRIRCDRKTLVQVGGIYLHHYYVDPFQFNGVQYNELSGNPSNHFFHPVNNEWIMTGNCGTSEQRSHCTFTEVNDNGVLVGGYVYSGQPEKRDQGHEYAFTKKASKDVKMMATCTGFQLCPMTSMDEPRAEHVTVYIPDDTIYVLGGHNDDVALSSVITYSLESCKWTNVEALEKAVYGHAGVTNEGKIFLTGGIEVVEKNEKTSNAFRCYDPDQRMWKDLPSMLNARSNHGMAILNNKFYVCGGQTDTIPTNPARATCAAEVYDPSHKQWTYINPMMIPAYGCSVIAEKDSLCVLGGANNSKDLNNEIQRYDPRRNKWTQHGTLPGSYRDFGLCQLTVKLFFPPPGYADSIAEHQRDLCFESDESFYDYYGEDDYVPDEDDYYEPDGMSGNDWDNNYDGDHMGTL